MIDVKFSCYDTADYLKTEENIAAYLWATRLQTNARQTNPIV